MSDFEPIEIDWSDPSMEPGLREGTVTKVEHKKEGQPMRSSKGDLMIKLIFRLEPTGTLHDYVMLQGPGAPMGARKLLALGIAKGSALIPNDLIGRRVTLDCVVEEYKGQTKLKAREYIALDGGDKPIPQGDAPW